MKIVKRFGPVLLTEDGTFVIRATPEGISAQTNRQVIVSTLVGDGKYKAFLYCFDCAFEDTDPLVAGTHWIPALHPDALPFHREWHEAFKGDRVTVANFEEGESRE